MNFGLIIPPGYAVSLLGDGRRTQAWAQAVALERIGCNVIRLNGWEAPPGENLDVLHIIEGAFGNSVGAMGRPMGVQRMGIAPFIDSNQPNWRYRAMAWIGSRHPQFVTTAGFYHRQMTACDAVIVRSSHERERIVRGIGIDRKKVKIVLNGVDPPKESDPELARGLFNLPAEYLLHVSLYSEPRKNVLRLIEAVAPTGLPLVIAGNPSGESEMLRAIRAAAAKFKNIQILGFQEPRVLQSLYAGCRVFCLPSLHEGTGLVALEAAAHGAGVVITQNGGPPDYFENFGYYVDPLEVEGMRESIQRAWENPRGEELREHVLTKLTWDQSAQSLVAAYQGLGEKPLPPLRVPSPIILDDAHLSGAGSPVATVVITSRNRKADLLQAIESCLTQDVPLEILAFDDSSTDGTSEAVRAKFPQVRIMRSNKQEGLIRLRNWGAKMASTNHIFSIDDDAIFTTPHVVRQTLADFDDPRIGAVAIPFKNVRVSDDVFQRAPENGQLFVLHGYIGTAHAVRRDVFLALGGYRASLVHQGEEGDYCVRMLDAGYVTRAGRSDVIHHFLSPVRDWTRLHYFGTRNGILFHWHNAPFWSLPWRVGSTVIGSLLHAVRSGSLRIKLRAVFTGHLYMLRLWDERKPVSYRAYSLFRWLLHAGPIPIEKISNRLLPAKDLESLRAKPAVAGSFENIDLINVSESLAAIHKGDAAG